jgi:hypothetical protein
MTRISSKSTAFHKRGLPVLWFGVVVLGVAVSFWAGALQRQPLLILPPAVLAVVGFVVMRKLVWDLVDEVFDGGDFLLVRNAGKEERVALSNIMNVSASTVTNPPRVTLRLSTPGRFGNEIVFSPIKPISLNPFARNKIAEDLIVRVDQARRGSREGSHKP